VRQRITNFGTGALAAGSYSAFSPDIRL